MKTIYAKRTKVIYLFSELEEALLNDYQAYDISNTVEFEVFKNENDDSLSFEKMIFTGNNYEYEIVNEEIVKTFIKQYGLNFFTFKTYDDEFYAIKYL